MHYIYYALHTLHTTYYITNCICYALHILYIEYFTHCICYILHILHTTLLHITYIAHYICYALDILSTTYAAHYIYCTFTTLVSSCILHYSSYVFFNHIRLFIYLFVYILLWCCGVAHIELFKYFTC